MSNFAGRCLAALFVLSAAFFVTCPANARHWNPTGKALAEDYLEIIDTQQEGRVVFLFWMAPPFIGNSGDATALLDKYVIIGVTVGHLRSTGLVFDPIEVPPVTDEAGTLLKAVPDEKLDASTSALLFTMKGMMKQAIGAMGEGIRFFVFESGNVHACSKGRLSVPVDNVIYTYDTPVPGCPAK
ncbi:MAG: hypothetical protein WCA81_13885 [Rhizomicrobium sp.]